jgi:hypothetical protein
MKNIFLFCALLSLASCFAPPDFPDRPSVSFVGIEGQKTVDLLGNELDSLTITVRFRDGDGDLGLSSTDVNPPFQPFLPDTLTPDGKQVLNFFHHNYHMEMKRKKGALTENIAFLDGGQLRGRFPRLTDGKGPIEGDLSYGKTFIVGRAGSPLKYNDTIFFVVRIVDRNKNISNETQTAPIILGQYD